MSGPFPGRSQGPLVVAGRSIDQVRGPPRGRSTSAVTREPGRVRSRTSDASEGRESVAVHPARPVRDTDLAHQQLLAGARASRVLDRIDRVTGERVVEERRAEQFRGGGDVGGRGDPGGACRRRRTSTAARRARAGSGPLFRGGSVRRGVRSGAGSSPGSIRQGDAVTRPCGGCITERVPGKRYASVRVHCGDDPSRTASGSDVHADSRLPEESNNLAGSNAHRPIVVESSLDRGWTG